MGRAEPQKEWRQEEWRQEEWRRFLSALAARYGFASWGVSSGRLPRRVVARLERFARAESEGGGFCGDMGWLKAKMERRVAPRALLPRLESVIMFGMSYAPSGAVAVAPLSVAKLSAGSRSAESRLAGSRSVGSRSAGSRSVESLSAESLSVESLPVESLPVESVSVGSDCGVISVYASGEEYHKVFKSRLKGVAAALHARFGGEYRVFVDTAPVAEKPLAQLSGLGWQGKHSNLVSRSGGSWLFLGSVFTTLKIPPDEPHGDYCGSCTRCIDVCPTGAIESPYRLSVEKCLAYWTVEHKGSFPLWVREAMGNRIFGCDDCLVVCPWNKFAQASAESSLLPRAELVSPTLKSLLELDEEGFRRLFRGTPVRRLGYERFLRNVLYAAGNSGSLSLLGVVVSHVGSGVDFVAEAARWSYSRLSRLR